VRCSASPSIGLLPFDDSLSSQVSAPIWYRSASADAAPAFMSACTAPSPTVIRSSASQLYLPMLSFRSVVRMAVSANWVLPSSVAAAAPVPAGDCERMSWVFARYTPSNVSTVASSLHDAEGWLLHPLVQPNTTSTSTLNIPRVARIPYSPFGAILVLSVRRPRQRDNRLPTESMEIVPIGAPAEFDRLPRHLPISRRHPCARYDGSIHPEEESYMAKRAVALSALTVYLLVALAATLPLFVNVWQSIVGTSFFGEHALDGFPSFDSIVSVFCVATVMTFWTSLVMMGAIVLSRRLRNAAR